VEDQINAIGIGRFQYFLLFIFALMVITDGMEMVVISLLYSALHSEWGLSELEEGLLASVIFTGFLIGNLIGGYLGDVWGRRNTLLLSGIVFLISATLSAFSPDLITLCIMRMIVGFAVGCKLPVSMTILVELTPSKSRGLYGMALSGFAFSAGEMFVCLAGIVIHTLDTSPDWWRTLLLACVLPDVIAVPLAWMYMPESPHFLLTQGREDELDILLEEVAVVNTGSRKVLLQDGRVRHVYHEEAPRDSWLVLDLFSNKLRSITVFMMIIWFVCCFTYYGHVFIYPIALEQRYHMQLENAFFAVFLSSLAEVPGVILGIMIVDMEGVGRRRSILLFFIAASLMALIVPYFTESTDFLIGNMVLKSLVNTPFCILYIFAAELFPTTHRASGIAFCSASSRIAGALSPLVTAWALTQSVDLTYDIFALAMALGALASISYEYETSQAQLPESMDDVFENSNKTKRAEERPLLSSRG